MDSALTRLLDGFEQFHKMQYASDEGVKIKGLVDDGQHLDYYFITCSDRV